MKFLEEKDPLFAPYLPRTNSYQPFNTDLPSCSLGIDVVFFLFYINVSNYPYYLTLKFLYPFLTNIICSMVRLGGPGGGTLESGIWTLKSENLAIKLDKIVFGWL